METIDDSILTALGTRSDRLFLYSLEDEFKHFVNTAKSDECIAFPTMTSYHRLLIHKVADRFGLYSESNGWGVERQTTVAKTERASLPCLSFRDFIIYEGTPPDRTSKKAKFDAIENPTAPPAEAPTTPALLPTTSTPSTTTTPTSTPTSTTTNLLPNPTTTPNTPIPTSDSSSNPSNNLTENAVNNSITNSNDISSTNNTPTNSLTNSANPLTDSTNPATDTPTHPPTNSTNPPTNSTNPPTNSATNPPTSNSTPLPKKTRKPPRTPDDGPRVMRGRGSSRFLAHEEEKDDFFEEKREGREGGEARVEEVGKREGEEGEKEEEGEKKIGGMRMDEEEEGMPKHKQLPLLNDYSQFEFGNSSNKSKSSNVYGFASHEHIIRIIFDLDKPGATGTSIDKVVAEYTKQKFTVKNKGNIYYAIFRSVAAAQALLEQARLPLTYQLSQLTLTSTPKKEEFPDEVFYPRPETTARVARRLIGNALDMANLQR